MNSRTRLVVAERPVIATEALHTWLERCFDVVEVVTESERLPDACRTRNAVVVLLDLNSSDVAAASCIRDVRRTGTRVFVLCSAVDRRTIGSVIAAGADAYAAHFDNREELVAALERVARGGSFYGPQVADAFADASGAGAYAVVDPAAWELSTVFHGSTPAPAPAALTSREAQILKLVATGHRSHAIAARLDISVPTVRKHRENIMKKLDLHNTAEVTAFAIRNGMLAGSERGLER